jgi:hypothetical protein
MRTSHIAIALLALAGCSRSFPSTFPRSSAASTEAAPARTTVMARALREDPPLPGEPTEGWEGLAPGAPQGGHHHGHH